MTEYLVYGPPRSGTNYISEWLYPYFYDRCACSDRLGEFFIHDAHDDMIPWNFDGERIYPDAPHTVPILQRLDWLQRSPHFYLLKEVSSHDHPVVFDYLRQRYHAIITYRKDIWQQLLSFVISLNTKIWYRSSLMPPPHITVSRRQHDFAMRLIDRGHVTGRSFPNRTSVAYEDFCADPYHLLDRLNLPRDDYDPYRHPRFAPRTLKLNHDHEASINNLDEVREWYHRWQADSTEPTTERNCT